MDAIIVVGWTSLFFLFVALVIYCRGYKDIGKQLALLVVGAVCCYILLVLLIVLAPNYMG